MSVNIVDVYTGKRTSG